MRTEGSKEPFIRNDQAAPKVLKIELYRDVAQLGSAPCSGRGGRKFESCHPDFYYAL